jgi:ribonuclease HI
MGIHNFGSAGKRSKEQTIAAKKYGEDLLKQVPDGSFLCFTDGSSFKGEASNAPGPSGAGVFIRLPKSPSPSPNIEAYAPLGNGSNNQAEIWAIGLACDLIMACGDLGNAPVEIFSDSKHSILALDYGGKDQANRALLKTTRSKIANLRKHRNVRIHWMPAHVGFFGNERADALAGKGSKASKKGLAPTDIPQRIFDGNFIINPTTNTQQSLLPFTPSHLPTPPPPIR